jgi:hypothetical protein
MKTKNLIIVEEKDQLNRASRGRLVDLRSFSIPSTFLESFNVYCPQSCVATVTGFLWNFTGFFLRSQVHRCLPPNGRQSQVFLLNIPNMTECSAKSWILLSSHFRIIFSDFETTSINHKPKASFHFSGCFCEIWKICFRDKENVMLNLNSHSSWISIIRIFFRANFFSKACYSTFGNYGPRFTLY